MSIQNKAILDMIEQDIKSPRPASFLGSTFYKHLNDFNASINRNTNVLDDFLSPCNEHILNPLNPVFLSQIYDLDLIEFVKYFMVRDGLYGVTDFFHRFPSPNNIKSILIIPEDFVDFVPEEWCKNVAYYSFKVDQRGCDEVSNDVLFIKGIGTSTSCNLLAIEDLASTICRKGIKKIIAYLPVRKDYFRRDEVFDEQTTHQVLSILIRKTKCDIQFLPWRDLLQCKVRGYFYDINGSGAIIFDDFLAHRLIAAGNVPLYCSKGESDKDDLFIRLSEYHGVRVISNEPQRNSTVASEAEKMKGYLCNKGELYQSDYIYYLKEFLESKGKGHNRLFSF
ncbi:MAG: hypothetical protein KAG61_08315 [Bacteriovoracaceae bacterium]|nr:hypothetical protein [Bacteriovoracaceae bacterium]